MALPHQFSCRAASTSVRLTRGFVPSRLLRSEKIPCVPEAKWVLWPPQSDPSSDVAHAEVRITTPPKNNASESHARMVTCLLEGASIRLSRTSRNDTEGLTGPSTFISRLCGCGPRAGQACSCSTGGAPADERVPDAPRGAGGAAPAHHHHGVLGLERRGRVRHHRRPLPEPGLDVTTVRHHRPGRFLPLRPLPALRTLQDRLPNRARDRLAGHRVLPRPAHRAPA